MKPKGFKCSCCGKRHKELPLHYGVAAPMHYETIPAKERKRRCDLNKDMCTIDDEHFYIVGNLEIPVIGSDERFSWDVWVSLSAKSMGRAVELWETPGRESEPPYFGWLSTSLPGYPETLLLKTLVHTREVGRRPFIELEPTTTRWRSSSARASPGRGCRRSRSWRCTATRRRNFNTPLATRRRRVAEFPCSPSWVRGGR